MNEQTHQKLMEIKRSFRLLMSGPTSQSMRDKGIEYKINWGVPFVELKKMATEYGKDYDLAIELWKENIRECKILATLIMPAEQMLPEIADLWMEQVAGQEMLYEIAGYHILSRLFAAKREANERGINEFLDQAAIALQGDNMGVKHAAANCVMRFADMDESYDTIAQKALKGILF